MARQTHTAFEALGTKTNAYTANAADLAMTAADAANYEEVVHSGDILIFAHNTGVGAVTITISSVVDDLGRTGDIDTYSLGAGEYACFGRLGLTGWRQTDGKLYFEASSADVKFAVIKL